MHVCVRVCERVWLCSCVDVYTNVFCVCVCVCVCVRVHMRVRVCTREMGREGKVSVRAP